MRHFFRINPDGYVFKLFSPIHILTLVALVLGLFIILMLYRKGDVRLKPIAKVLFVALLIEQFLLYFWYFFLMGFDPVQALPLYSCRIAMLAIILSVIIKSDSLLLFGGYLGFPGGILALISPVLDNFSYPHLTNFTYFLGHLLLCWLCFIILVEKAGTKKQLSKVVIYTVLFFIITYFVDIHYGANYSYMLWAPIFTSQFAKLNHGVYIFVLIMIYTLILTLTHLGFKSLRKHLVKINSNINIVF